MRPTDVIDAIQKQNIQVAAGRVGQPPVPAGAAVPFDLPINTQGRLSSEEEFQNIIVKSGSNGQLVYLRDVVRERWPNESEATPLRGAPFDRSPRLTRTGASHLQDRRSASGGKRRLCRAAAAAPAAGSPSCWPRTCPVSAPHRMCRRRWTSI